MTADQWKVYVNAKVEAQRLVDEIMKCIYMQVKEKS